MDFYKYFKKFTVQYVGPISPSYLAVFRERYEQLIYQQPRIYKFISRYSRIRLIQDDIAQKVHHEIFPRRFIEKSNEDSSVQIDNVSENRLDIIANSFYGDPKYWWYIAQANNIIDPFDVPRDVVLRVPITSTLYTENGILSLK